VAERLGRPVTNSTAYGRGIRDAGFEDVVERHLYWPLNMWPPGKEERLIGTWVCSSVVVEYVVLYVGRNDLVGGRITAVYLKQ
jgi:hypothetical protein